MTIGNLQWMRCSLGQQWNSTTCTGDATKHNWEHSNALPDLINAQGGFAGHSDWRLTTASELASLRVCSSGQASRAQHLPKDVTTFGWCLGQYSTPTLDTHLFPNTEGSGVWSGTPLIDLPGNLSGIISLIDNTVWNVQLGYGGLGIHPATSYRQVRLVRSEQ